MKKIKYPCMMQHEKGLVVLFHAPACGTVLAPDRPECLKDQIGLPHPVGEYRTDWLENSGYWKKVKSVTVKL